MYWFRLWVVACTVVLQRSRMLCRCVEPKELAVADTILELLLLLGLLVPFVGCCVFEPVLLIVWLVVYWFRLWVLACTVVLQRFRLWVMYWFRLWVFCVCRM
jgi:hypothetical protein